MQQPAVGDVLEGYRFRGGNPNQQENWEPLAASIPSPTPGTVLEGYIFLGGDPNKQENWKPEGQEAEEPAEEPTFVERNIPGGGLIASAADLPINFAQGVVGFGKGVTDLAGAGNPVSNALGSATQYLQSITSAQSREDFAEARRLTDEAEGKGVWEEIKANARAIGVAPLDFLSRAAGSTVPAIVAGALASTPVGASVLAAGVGLASGVGAAKGDIYDVTKQELAKAGVAPEEVEAAAQEAQSYGGENLDLIALGGAIGAIAARSGVEPAVGRAIMQRISARTGATVAAKEAAERTVKGLGTTGLKRAAEESITEGFQGGQEKFAQNIALQRQGFDVPTFRGVAGQATQEGILGGVLGGGSGVLEARVNNAQINRGGREEEADAEEEEADAEREAGVVTPTPRSAQARAEAAMDLNSQAEQQAQQAQQLQEQQDRSKTLYDRAVELLPTLGGAVSAKSLHEALKTSVGPEVKYNEVLPILGQLATNGRIGEPDKKTMKRPVLVSAAQGSLDLNQVAPTVAPGLEKVIPENAELQGAVDAKAGLPTAAPVAAPVTTPVAAPGAAPVAAPVVSSASAPVGDPSTQGELDLGPSRFTLSPAASPAASPAGSPAGSPVVDPSTQGELDFSQTAPPTPEDVTTNDIHDIAASKGIKSDDDPVFMARTKERYGVEKLDDLSAEDRADYASYLLTEAPTSDGFNIPAGADMTVTPNVGDMEAALSDIGNLRRLHNTFASLSPQEAPALVKTGMLPAIQKTIASVKTALKSQPYAARVAEETEEQAAASAADQEASPVGNNIQWALRDAQRAAGRGNFQEALEHLEALEDIATREDYAAEAAKNDPKLVENTFAPAPHETRSPAFFSRAVGVVREAGKVNVTGLAQSLGVPVRAARDLVARMEAAGVVKKRNKGWDVTPTETVGAPAKRKQTKGRTFKTVAEADRAAADRRIAEEQAKGVAERDAALGPTVYNRGETKTTLMSKSIGEDPPTEESSRWQGLVEGKTLRQVAGILASEGSPVTRLIAKRVEVLIRALENIGVTFSFHVAHEDDLIPARLKYARGITRMEAGQIRIAVWVNGADLKNKVGTSERTLLHELLHAVTMGAIDIGKYNLVSGTALGTAVRDLIAVRTAVIKHFNARVAASEAGGPPLTEFEQAIYDERVNAVADSDEVLVWALTHPDMQAYLETIPYKGAGSAWSAFVRAVRTLLGLTPAADTALSEVLRVGDILLSTDPKTVGGYRNKIFPGSKTTPQREAAQVSQRTAGLMASSNLAAVTTLDKIKSIRSFKDAYELADTLWSGLDMDGKKLLLQALPTRDILRLIKKYTPAIVYDEAAALYRKIQALIVERGRLMKVGMKTAERWEQYDSLGTAAQQALWNAMNFSTLYRVDPSTAPNAAAFLAKEQAASGVIGHKPGRMDEVKDVYEFWNEAGKYGKGVYNGQAIYKEVRDSYIATLDAQERLLLAIINGSAASDKQTMMTSLQVKFQEVRQLAPYFPLSRDGQYGFIHGKGDDRVVVLRETVAARNIAMADYAKSKGTSTRDMIANDGLKVINNAEEKKKQITEAPGLLKDILAHLDKSGGTLDPDAVKKMKEDVYEMFLMTLPDSDMRKKFLPRKGTGGFNPDARRAFLKHVHASSYQLARLEYSGEVRNAISQMKGTLKANPNQSQIKPFLDRMEARARAEIEPKSQDDYSFLDKVADVGTQASFFMMLTSMKTALINLTQLPIVGANVLGGRFGYGKTTAMMAKYLKLSNTFGVSERVTTPLGATENQFRMPSVEYSKMMQTPRMRAAFEAGVAQDIFEKTYLMALAGGRSTPSGTESSALTKGFRVGMNVITGGLHHVERISREIMYMSTYELSYNENIAKGMSAKDAQAAAIEDAVELTTEAMFDYSQSNKPELMRNPVGRLAFQFMTFPMQMISLLVRNAHGSFATLPPSEKKRARSVFFGVLGVTFMFAGMSGMPGMGLVLGMLDGLRDVFRGDDEDDDDELDPLSDNSLEYWLREVWIPQTFGPDSDIAKALGLSATASKLVEQSLISGPISALTGADFSGSVGLDNLIYHSDQSGNTNKEDYYQGVVGALLGPTGALGAQIASAMDDFGNDDTSRGMEKLFPAFFKGLVRATRLASEGNLTRTGAEIKSAEYYTTGKLALQIIGFGDTEVNQIQKANSLAKSVQAEDAQKKSSLLNRMDKLLSKYKRDQTPEAEAAIDADIDAVYDEIEQYNRRSPDPITRADIRASQDEREKARGRAVYGLVLPKPFARYLRDRQ